MGLLGPNGKPISSGSFQNKKADPPKLGEAFGNWAGRDLQYVTLPGGGIVQFDLSKLTLADYRQMRDHYQVNASLAVLSFMQHQSDWHIECEDKKVADSAESFLRDIWTPMNRSLSQANWAGYSPTVLDWENDVPNRKIFVNKVKDMVPEECRVNWKEIPGWAPPGRTPPKFKIYDGIKREGDHWPIPVENTLWYPLLMENGDYYGRKLLRPAFQSWFFSILIHLFANRYYERFGEPTPVGRAPFEEEIDVQGTSVRGNEYMLGVLRDLRSRSVVVLPNDKSEVGNGNQTAFDYDIEYLESQMRGADFERYLTRLDEEISIGLFMPILMFRTADVGSYNLGQGHERTYQIILNTLNDDRAQYLDNYLLRKYVDYNVSPSAPPAKIVFRKQGLIGSDLIKEIMTALLNQKQIKVDIKELGQMTGMTLEEVEQTVNPPAPVDPNADPADPAAQLPEARATAKEIIARVRPQVENAFKNDTFGPDLQINMGYKNKFEKALEAHGFQYPQTAASEMYGRMDNWLRDVVGLGSSEFSGADTFMSLFERVLDNEIADLSREVK